MIGDSDAVGVAAEIGQHLLRPAKGRLGVDDPLALAEWVEIGGALGGITERREFSEELEFALLKSLFEGFQEQAAEQAREYFDMHKKPGRQGTQRSWSEERPPPGTTQCRCG